MRKYSIGLLAALIGAASLAQAATPLPTARTLRGAFKPERARAFVSRSKRYPQMVTSSDEAIAAHNRAVSTRQVRRHAARHGG